MKVKTLDAKLYIVSIIVGIFTGAVCIPFRYTVNRIAQFRPELFDLKNPVLFHASLFAAIYLVLLLVNFLVEKFPKITGSGLPQTQALLYGRVVYDRPFTYLLMKYIGGVLSLGSGLSLGREGTSVQMGSLAGYLTGNLFNFRLGRRRHLIAAGAGAGVSAAFTAPLSSSILILESLQKFNVPKTAICTLLAGGTAGIMAKFLIPENIYSSIHVATGKMEWKLLIVFFLMAVFFSLLGKLFSSMLLYGKKLYAGWKVSKYRKVAFLAVITWGVGTFFPTMIGGDQTFLIDQAGNQSIKILMLLLFITVISSFTILSNSSGFPGGIFLPMMTVGGLAGKLFYELFYTVNAWLGPDRLHPLFENEVYSNLSGYFILIGMSAFFISVVRTPLTGFILISEMTGHYEVFFPTLIVGIMVFYFTQLLKVTPMNDLLYRFMISQETEDPPRTVIYLEISLGSYFDGKTPSRLTLPQGCEIIKIYRKNKEIEFKEGIIIMPDDQVAIEINSSEIEQVYQPLVSMSLSIS